MIVVLAFVFPKVTIRDVKIKCAIKFTGCKGDSYISTCKQFKESYKNHFINDMNFPDVTHAITNCLKG